MEPVSEDIEILSVAQRLYFSTGKVGLHTNLNTDEDILQAFWVFLRNSEADTLKK